MRNPIWSLLHRQGAQAEQLPPVDRPIPTAVDEDEKLARQYGETDRVPHLSCCERDCCEED